MIYLSSSTVYQKNHFIGQNKRKIEKYLISKKKKIPIFTNLETI